MSAAGPDRRATTTRDDWETPQPIFDKLNTEFGFGLDAAATEASAKCERWRSEPCIHNQERSCACGLHGRWIAPHETLSVWLNPPYGRGLHQWVNKCVAESAAGATVVALLPDAMDTAWFRDVFRTAWEVRVVWGRIQFDGTTSSNTCGSILAVWRPGERPYGQPVFSLWEQPNR